MGVFGFIGRSLLWTGVLIVLAGVIGIVVPMAGGALDTHVGGPFDGWSDVLEAEEFDEREVELAIIQEVNDERNAIGLGDLHEHQPVTTVARSHSEQMAQEGSLQHDFPDSRADYRVSAAGCAFGGENIAGSWVRERIKTEDDEIYTRDEERLAEQLVISWMNSEGHRQNILESQYTVTGVGVEITEDGEVYATQMFCA